MAGWHADAGHLLGGLLAERTVCRLRHQRLLPAGGGVRTVPLAQESAGRPCRGFAHHTHTAGALPVPAAGVPCVVSADRVDAVPHGQHRALVGRLHHRTVHCGHVDAGPQVAGAMVGVDAGGCGQLRPVYI